MSGFWHWWQHIPLHLNPVIFSFGGFKLQYYGLMYVVAFLVTYLLVAYRLRHEARFLVTAEQAQALITAMMLGVVVGGRLGYVLFYNLSYYLAHPLEVILPFDFSNGVTFTGITGMSFHGGLVGVILFSWLYCRKNGLRLLEMADLFIPAIPLGYTFGRIGNFINGELYGRVTSAPIGMMFPLAPGSQLRHPSQLYEALFEGVFLFLVLWGVRRRVRTPGAMLGLYLIGYGTVRFFIEYFRQPDAHLGYVLLSFSMGQVLCLLMIGCGALLLAHLYRRQRLAGNTGVG
ncbi:MAG: prolipoprotein diacylglyceryl transferase [Desulfobacterales bacterium]